MFCSDQTRGGGGLVLHPVAFEIVISCDGFGRSGL